MEITTTATSPQFWKNKKVFLTGHTGFKGAWTAFILSKWGAKVCGYALKPNTNPSLFDALSLSELLQHQIGDIRNFDQIKKSLQQFQPEIVIHMAAQPLVRYSYTNPMETFETNIMGTVYLLEALREVPSVKSIVIVTTDKVYENLEKGHAFSESNPLGGNDPYSSSKACTEIVTHSMRVSFYNTPSSALVASARAGNVIGGGDWATDRLIPDIVRAIASNSTVQIRNPLSIRPWQHVLEPISAYLLLAENLYQGEKNLAQAWNFGPELNDAKEVQYLTQKISELWNSTTSWNIDKGPHPHEAHYLKLDITKAQEKLNWNPRWNIDEALFHTVTWYKNYYNNNKSARGLCAQQIDQYFMRS